MYRKQAQFRADEREGSDAFELVAEIALPSWVRRAMESVGDGKTTSRSALAAARSVAVR
jgi:hypothetical protein